MSDTNKNPLRENLEFYINNQPELVRQFGGKILLIHDCQVVDSYETKGDAFFAGSGMFAPGTFTVMMCSEGEEAYTVNYRTVHRFSRMVPTCQ